VLATAHHGQLHGIGAQGVRLNAHEGVEVNHRRWYITNGAEVARKGVVLCQEVARTRQSRG
jgi:hypothetical protein